MNMKMKKFYLFQIIVLLMLMIVSCSSSGQKTKTSTKETETSAQEADNFEGATESEGESESAEDMPYSIVKKTFQKENAEIPKVYLDTAETPGREEYVTTTVKIVDGSGQYEEIYDANAGLKVRGHTTAHGEKVPYNIKFEEKKNILGMGESKKWCLIANLFDATLMRNMLALDFARNMGMDYVSKCEYVELYYNGMDMGVYLLCTPVSEGTDKVDLDLSEHDYLLQLQPNYTYSDKTNITTGVGMILSIEEGDTEDLTYLNDFMKNFETSIAYGLEAFSQYADVDSFVDFYVFNEIMKDVDFATSSTYFYIKEGKMYAGPAWDYDLSMGNADKEYYDTYNNEGSGENYEGFYCQKLWFIYLMQIPEFQNRVMERFYELQPLIENLTADNELGRNRIDDILDNYGAEFEHNFTIWEEGKKYGANSMTPYATYEENVAYLRQWIVNRNEWLKIQWKVSEGIE